MAALGPKCPDRLVEFRPSSPRVKLALQHQIYQVRREPAHTYRAASHAGLREEQDLSVELNS